MSNKRKVKIGFWRESFGVSEEDFRYLEELKSKKIDEAESENIGDKFLDRMDIISSVILLFLVFFISPLIVFFSILVIGFSMLALKIYSAPTIFFLIVSIFSFYIAKRYIRYRMSDRVAQKIKKRRIETAKRIAENEFYEKVLKNKSFNPDVTK